MIFKTATMSGLIHFINLEIISKTMICVLKLLKADDYWDGRIIIDFTVKKK